jgi:hypothetical protein
MAHKARLPTGKKVRLGAIASLGGCQYSVVSIFRCQVCVDPLEVAVLVVLRSTFGYVANRRVFAAIVRWSMPMAKGVFWTTAQPKIQHQAKAPLTACQIRFERQLDQRGSALVRRDVAGLEPLRRVDFQERN